MIPSVCRSSKDYQLLHFAAIVTVYLLRERYLNV